MATSISKMLQIARKPDRTADPKKRTGKNTPIPDPYIYNIHIHHYSIIIQYYSSQFTLVCIHHSFHLLPCIPISVFAVCWCLTDNQWEPETEFSLCEHVMELLEMPEKAQSWDLRNAIKNMLWQFACLGNFRQSRYFESVLPVWPFLTFSRFFHFCCIAVVFARFRMCSVWQSSDYFSTRSLVCFWCSFFLVDHAARAFGLAVLRSFRFVAWLQSWISWRQRRRL